MVIIDGYGFINSSTMVIQMVYEMVNGDEGMTTMVNGDTGMVHNYVVIKWLI